MGNALTRPAFVGLATSLVVTACMGSGGVELPPTIPAVSGERKTMPVALEYIDVVQGTGAPMASRKCVYAHYTGWLTDGTKFDSSRDAGPDGQPRDPIAFNQGTRRVIMGWDMGFEGMRVGGRRRLFVPYMLAYGEAGRAPIPPRATLIFDIELMAVADTLASTGPQQVAACPPWSDVRGR